MLTLFTSPGSCAFATHLALAEAGADYAIRRVKMAENEQRSPEYLAINPLGRVPALVTPDGVLTETPALLIFVAQSYPTAKLAPMNDPVALAKLQSFNSYLATTVHVAHAHGRRAYRWTDDEAAMETMRAKVPQTMAEAFTLVEKALEGPWVMGEQFTVADGYLYTLGRWLEIDKVDTAQFPKVMAHRARMNERPAVQRALAEEKAA
ncbi:glutathione S-transferase family protein [Acuticoccus sp. I52.16.1]|uniref:glutathione S-transferase family protein n=1 Tax=Acuticoccus sp. I52.16.1 TaxID=2928472 RepID=UPI001FD2181F|nr:glutathione S-transferase family protein [Acuticoccus sp. I52.16.1]UOM33048.1 glutathione S-transferase family protein [Acuticoccus sp. I52.16.1]